MKLNNKINKQPMNDDYKRDFIIGLQNLLIDFHIIKGLIFAWDCDFCSGYGETEDPEEGGTTECEACWGQGYVPYRQVAPLTNRETGEEVSLNEAIEELKELF